MRKNTVTLQQDASAPGVAIHVSTDDVCVLIQQGTDIIAVPPSTVLELIEALAAVAREVPA